jgi:hypothetical protein
LNIYKKFEAFRVTLSLIDENISSEDHAYCLIKIDTTSNKGAVTLFRKHQAKEATEQYLAAEKISAKTPELISALVSVASVDNLKEAFPNYFADSTMFVDTLRSVPVYHSGFFVRFLTKYLKGAGL